MSTSIELEFETHIDLDFVEQGIAVHLIRLTASLQLQTREGWTRKYKALVDTGNPISVIPNSVWSKGKINWILSHRSDLLGIGGGKVSGKLGEVTLVLVDKKTASPPIKAKALLLDDDSVPFLIGFEDIMTDIKLVCDYKSKTSFFQIR
ncbi:MAG: hypothetical protein KKH04_03540 [Proteobacteria bacterium]|nr:hypothetical protein [Pseudomonadota bacterium]